MADPSSRPDLPALAERYSGAWIAHDVDAIVALHTADSRFHSHGRDHAVQGREALRTEFAGVFSHFPNFGVDVHRLLFGDRHWVLDWTLTFQSIGGERRGFQCLDLVEVTDDGLISSKETYFDFAEYTAAMSAAS
ncbi:nuclear transport factor 2 family protein [Actinomadura sp. 3N407]|uniref:nuclear transport factor 2 family protein n=1 Tax=Actinomadura sp. 3N407 TaxID=3457423 RepID=UPI003FCDE9A5